MKSTQTRIWFSEKQIQHKIRKGRKAGRAERETPICKVLFRMEGVWGQAQISSFIGKGQDCE